MASSNSIKPSITDSASKTFDARYGTSIPFSCNVIPISNAYRIMSSNSEKTVIYEGVNETSQYTCDIPENGIGGRISNGNKYLFQVKISYINNGETVESAWSDECFIRCFTTSTLSLTNLPPHGEEDPAQITVPTITIGINYTSGEGSDYDELNEFKYVIYDADKNVLTSSDTYHDKSQMYSIYGLDNNKIYFLRAAGTTAYGQVVDTGYVKIVVHLGSAGTSSVLSVENNKCEGNILVSTNIDTQGYYKERDAINYYSPTDYHADDPAKIWSGYFLDTLSNGYGYVCYTRGFYINGEFSSKVTFGQPLDKDRVFYYKDTNDNEITARYMLVKGLDNTTVKGAYFLLEVVHTETVNDVVINRIVNNYATDIFTPLTNYDLVDLAVGREKVLYDEHSNKYYYSYTINAKVTTYNDNGEVVNEAWY